MNFEANEHGGNKVSHHCSPLPKLIPNRDYFFMISKKLNQRLINES